MGENQPEGTPERIGRMLGHLVARGRIAASDPATRERLAAAGREAARRAQPVVKDVAGRAGKEWEEHGPDVAERAAHRAVDGALWGISLRSGFVAAALRPFAQQVREAAGTLARDLAAAARAPAGTAEQGAGDTKAAPAPQPEPPQQDPGHEEPKS